MNANSYIKDKGKIAMYLTYSFAPGTDPEVEKAFLHMLVEDLCFSHDDVRGQVLTLSDEYTPDVRNVRDNIKRFIKENTPNIGVDSRISFYFTKPDEPSIKVRTYTFK